MTTSDIQSLIEKLSRVTQNAKELTIVLERLGGSQDSFIILIKEVFKYLPLNVGEDLTLNVKHQGELTIQAGTLMKLLSDDMIGIFSDIARIVE